MSIYIGINAILLFLKPVFLHLEYQWYFGIRFFYVVTFLAFMFDSCKVLYLLIESCFGNGMIQKFLDTLYEELWYNPIRKIEDNEKWKDIEVIKSHTNYLMERYLLYAQKIKSDEIHKIAFSTNLYEGEEEYKRERYVRVKERSTIWLSVIFSGIWSVFIILFYLKNQSFIQSNKMPIVQWVILPILIIGGVFGLFYILAKKSTSFAMVGIVLFAGRYGYELIYKEDSKKILKNRFVKEVVLFRKSSCFKYIHSMKNLIAFYLIAPTDAKKVIYEELSKDENRKSQMYLPMFALDCLSYINGEPCLFPLEKTKDVDLIICFARAFCLDIGKRCYNHEEEFVIEKVEEYKKSIVKKNKEKFS